MPIKHTYVSSVPDDGYASKVQPSDWNDSHDLSTLTLDEIAAGTTNKAFAATLETKLNGIEAGAEVNNISDANALDLTDGGTTTLHTHTVSGVPIFGTATLNFSTGLTSTSVAVTGQTDITAGAKVQAFIMADDTSADHTANDHRYIGLFMALSCGALVAGTGFTIYANSLYELVGQYSVRWMWTN